MPTLLEVLQRENPSIIDHWAGVSYNNTTSTRFDEVTLDDGCRAHVQEWKDFTFGSIYAAYGDILDQELGAAYKGVHTPTTTPREVIDENGIDTLGIVWSCNIVREPLKTAGAILRNRQGMVSTALARPSDPTLASKNISWKHTTDPKSSIKPDWAVVDRSMLKKYRHAYKDDPEKPLVYAVGDSKLKQKWKSAWLSFGDAACTVNTDPPYHAPGTPAPNVPKTKDIKLERTKPLRQLATYCRYGESRYGYIVTQTELVALRVRRIPGGSPHTAAVEYCAIPWSAHGNGKLTAHLAIWALGCMGMNDHERAMEGPNNSVLPHMAKLTWWTEDKVKKTFTNVISRRVVNAEQWVKLKASTTPILHTYDAGGKSLTSTFTGTRPALPGLTQQMANLNLGKAGTPTATPQKGAQATPQKGGQTTPQKQAPAAAAAATPLSSNKPRPYTKCTIDGKTYGVATDAAGNYAVMDSKKTAKFKLVRDAKKGWVVSGNPNVVVKMEY